MTGFWSLEHWLTILDYVPRVIQLLFRSDVGGKSKVFTFILHLNSSHLRNELVFELVFLNTSLI